MNKVTEELIRFGVTGFTHEVPDFTEPELVDKKIFIEDNGQGFQKYFTSEEAAVERHLGVRPGTVVHAAVRVISTPLPTDGDGGQMSGDYPLLRCTGMQL